MKIYNLNIDTSKPVNKVMQMQSNSTGLLKLNVTNGGKSIRNLTTKVYDGETEVPSTDNGFKIDLGKNDKVVKVEAKSTLVMCEWEDAIPEGNRRIQQIKLKRLQLDTGVYNQDEFYELSKYGDANGYYVTWDVDSGTTNFKHILIQPWNTERPVLFLDANNHLIEANVPISVDGHVEVVGHKTIKCTSYTKESHTYPAFGYYTDYQLDTTIRPSVNAPYDGEYEEPLTEIEVDGVKFVPTTLTIDGVEYKVLAEEQPEPTPEEPTEPETPTEPTNNDGE